MKVRSASQRKKTAKAMASEASPCQERNMNNSPADNGASSLISPITTPKDPPKDPPKDLPDEQLVINPRGSHHDSEIEAEEASPVPSPPPPSPESFRFTRHICACCSQGPESFTGEPGDDSFKQLLKDRVLDLIFGHDAEMTGNIFAKGAQRYYPEKVWSKTELKLALADSEIYNLGLEVLEEREKGLIEGWAGIAFRAKRELRGEIRQKERERNDGAQSLFGLFNAMEEEERMEKKSASKTLMELSATSTEDDEATLDGEETEIDERYQ